MNELVLVRKLSDQYSPNRLVRTDQMSLRMRWISQFFEKQWLLAFCGVGSFLFALCTPIVADTDVPPTVNFAIQNIAVVRSSGSVTIPVNVSGDPMIDFSGTRVQFLCNEGTAEWVDDFDTIFPSLTFHAGETQKFLVIGIQPDSVDDNRFFTVRIENGSDYNVGPANVVTVTILARAPDVRPKVRILSPKRARLVNRGILRISGKATPASGLTIEKVAVKVNQKFLISTGTNSWSAKTRVKKKSIGKISVVVTDSVGQRGSASSRFRVR